MARQRRKGWQADLRLPDGRRMRPQFTTQAQAEAWEATTRSAIEDGRPLPTPIGGGSGHRDLSTWGGLFEHTKKHSWVKADAGSNLIRNGKAVVDYFGANTQASTVTEADLNEFATHLAEARGNTGATINRKMAAASKMLSLALRHHTIPFKPKMPKQKEGKGRIRRLSEAEEELMLTYWRATSDPLNEHLTEFLIDTGARAFSEAGRLRWEDISERGATFWDTKADLPRTVPLSARARAACEAMREFNHEGPFFGVTSDKIKSRWERMRTHTGLHDVTPHVLRHTCASRFVMAGVDVRRVKDWLGHKTIQTTMRYAQLAPHALDEMAELQNKRAPVTKPVTTE